MSSLEYWKNEFKKITDTDVVTSTKELFNKKSLPQTDNSNKGYYYSIDGEYLGKEGESENVFLAKKKIKDFFDENLNKKVKKEIFINKINLSIKHSEFRQKASTIYGESSAYKLNNISEEFKKEIFAIASVHEINNKAYGKTSDKAKEYLSLTPYDINKSKFKTLANAALINAKIKGRDYSNGAVMWDGREQALYPETDNRRSTGKFELHMNTMGWNIKDEHFQKWKNNIGEEFQAPQQKKSPENYGNYKNKGKMRLESTAVYLETIFWKIKS